MTTPRISDQLFQEVVTLADGEGRTFDARATTRMSVTANTGATVTWTRVDDPDTTSHGSGSRVQTPPAAGNMTTISVDWPYYRVSTSGGTADVAIV